MVDENQEDQPLTTQTFYIRQDTLIDSTEFSTATKDRKIWRAMIIRGHHLT